MMASPLWMPGAARHPVGDTAPCDTRYPPKAIAHITWSSVPVRFSSMLSYFTVNPEGRPKAPHILWDPITGQFAQFYPADSRSKSVADKAGGTRTNRAGRVVIQIEALFSPGKTMHDGRICRTLLDTPCNGWPALLTWITGLGVPQRWPMGMPDWHSQRSEKTWETQGGWYGHSQVPENTHTDPGPWPGFDTYTLEVHQEEDDMALFRDLNHFQQVVSAAVGGGQVGGAKIETGKPLTRDIALERTYNGVRLLGNTKAFAAAVAAELPDAVNADMVESAFKKVLREGVAE